jgi:hypothetical protein
VLAKDNMTPTQGEVRSWARAQGMTVNPRGSLPSAIMKAYMTAHSGAASNGNSGAGTAAAGSADLAGGMRGFLASVDTEVRAVSELSERIDRSVTELNALRDEQAKRLLVLDELQAAAGDASLTAFLNKAIRPRRAQVAEVVPERLQ